LNATVEIPPFTNRLARELPWKTEIGCILLTSLILVGVGGFVLYMEHVHPPSSLARNAWVPSVVGGGFFLVGVLVLFGAVYGSLASRSPETVVAIDKNELRRGERVTVHILQPGPMRLKSLRADLFGEELRIRGYTNRLTTRTDLGTFKFFAQDDIVVRNGEVFHRSATLDIPQDIPPSATADGGTVTWRIEVWGAVRRGFNFRHPFVVKVT
jgi:hypothetical protein